MGEKVILPKVPSYLPVRARSVANARCTTITAPTWPWNRRAPYTWPSSMPQKIFSRPLTRSTAVRPAYRRSNCLVARGMLGKRRRSISCLTHWRVADAIVTKDRARLIVDDVQGRAAAEHLLWLFELEIAILDDRRDLFVVQEFMNRAIICCLVVRQRLDASVRQILLGLFDQFGNAFIVAGLGVGDVVGERDFVLDIDQQMQLVAEPFDDVRDLAIIVFVLFLAAGRLRQPLLEFGVTQFFTHGGTPRQAGGVSRGVFAKIANDQAEPFGHDVEDAA